MKIKLSFFISHLCGDWKSKWLGKGFLEDLGGKQLYSRNRDRERENKSSFVVLQWCFHVDMHIYTCMSYEFESYQKSVFIQEIYY